MSKQPVIIIRKKKGGHAGHHGGAWKVAYADFVTAMMAFFMVLWIVGQSKEVRAGVAGYFRDPGVLDNQHSTGIMPGGTTGIDPQAPPQLAVTPPGSSAADKAADKAAIERSAQRIRELLQQLPDVDQLKDQIEIRATSEGLLIELIDSSAATFFDSASAQLKPATERVLAVIAPELHQLGRPVVVEGHTDSRQYPNPRGYTNWELSSDRANAARRQMEKAGLGESLLLAVRGYADNQPAHPEAPLDPRNRRISIVVMAHAPSRGGGGR